MDRRLRTIDLHVAGAAVLRRVDPHVLVLGTDALEQAFRFGKRRLPVFGPVHDKEIAVDLVGNGLQAEFLQLGHGSVEILDAQDVQQVVFRRAEGRAVGHLQGAARLEVQAPFPHAVVVVDHRPGHAGFDALLEGHGTRGVVAAQAGRNDAEAAAIDIGPLLQVVNHAADRDLGIVTRHQAAQPECRALPRPVHREAGDAAHGKRIGDREHLFLGAVEPVGQNDRGSRSGHAHGRDEVGLQAGTVERNVKDLNLRLRELREPGEGRQVPLVQGLGLRVGRAGEGFRPLVVLRRPVEGATSGDAAASIECGLGRILDLIGQARPRGDPGRRIAARPLAGCLVQAGAGPVDVAKGASGHQTAQDGERPGVVSGEVQEHRFSFDRPQELSGLEECASRVSSTGSSTIRANTVSLRLCS
ncbi:hypothetical protein D9M68_400400 [compost metagenome]